MQGDLFSGFENRDRNESSWAVDDLGVVEYHDPDVEWHVHLGLTRDRVTSTAFRNSSPSLRF